jgi:phosphoenolpyruvate carboxylase
VEPIVKAQELLAPLRIIYDSLVETGFELVADGHVSDIIRRVAVFGMTLVPLDIREESTRHTLALDAITRHLGIGSYKVGFVNVSFDFEISLDQGTNSSLYQISTLGTGMG